MPSWIQRALNPNLIVRLRRGGNLEDDNKLTWVNSYSRFEIKGQQKHRGKGIMRMVRWMYSTSLNLRRVLISIEAGYMKHYIDVI